MKKNRIFSFILSLVLSVSICGCTKKANENRDESKATLVNKNGQYYIQLDDNAGNNASYDSSKIIQYIYFSSMDEFYSRVTELDFSEEEIDIMHSFSRDDNGIKVCDMDNLYQLVLPNDASVENIAWSGNEYVTLWNSPSVTQGMAFMLNTEGRFQNEMAAALPDDYFEQENIEVLDYAEVQNTGYTTKKWTYNHMTVDGKFKKRIEVYETDAIDLYRKIIIRYTIEKPDANSDIVCSDTIPFDVSVFTKRENKYCWNLMTKIEDPLDIDWLMSFDIEPYVAE